MPEEESDSDFVASLLRGTENSEGFRAMLVEVGVDPAELGIVNMGAQDNGAPMAPMPLIPAMQTPTFALPVDEAPEMIIAPEELLNQTIFFQETYRVIDKLIKGSTDTYYDVCLVDQQNTREWVTDKTLPDLHAMLRPTPAQKTAVTQFFGLLARLNQDYTQGVLVADDAWDAITSAYAALARHFEQ